MFPTLSPTNHMKPAPTATITPRQTPAFLDPVNLASYLRGGDDGKSTKRNPQRIGSARNGIPR